MKGFWLIFLWTVVSITTQNTFAQSSPSTLDIVSWNIEWFGSTSNGPANDNLQRENAKKVMRYLDADIYGLTEMVDTTQIRRLVDSLGSNYGYVVSPFCSGANSPGSNAWRTGQKLVFVYKKDIFSNVTTRGMLRASTGDAYTNWASGRFPFQMNANVTINGVTKNVNFIVIHGKAGATASDYQRRKDGADELKDTLDAQFPNSLNILFGDFNDALNQTISTGSGPASSYQSFVIDSTDADHYKSITLPLAYAGQSTMTSFPNVIDNHVISNELAAFYVAGSAKIRTDVTTVVPDYVSADNTSDHWPVFSQYSLSGMTTSVPNISPSAIGLTAFPNPFNSSIFLKAAKNIINPTVRITNLQGQVLFSAKYGLISAGTTIQPPLPNMAAGTYLVEVQTTQFRSVLKLVKLPE